MSEKKFHILSFKYAIEGLTAALKKEPNLKFHLVFALFVIVAGFILRISQRDWIIVVILIGLIISVELTNTAIEAIVDAFAPTEHPGAKLAKDISAGAVLVVSITAAACGLIVFLHYLT